MKQRLCLLYTLLLAIGLFASTSSAESVTLFASQDAWVYDAQPTATPAQGSFINLASSPNTQQWGFYQFDLSSIPDTAVITTAYFQTYGAASWSTASDWSVPYDRYPYYYHVSDDSWLEDSLTWNDKPVHGDVLGRSAPGSAWTTSKAYFTLGTMDNWDESVDLADNYLSFAGLIGDTQGYYASYYSYNSESGGSSGPQLYLEYTVEEDPGTGPMPPAVPEPSTILLLGAGLLGLIGIGRKKLS